MAKRNKQIDAEVIACASAGRSFLYPDNSHAGASENALKRRRKGERAKPKYLFRIRFKAVLKNYKHIKGILKCK